MSCLFHLYEENAQSFLEDNLGRCLTPVEINRMKLALLENDRAQFALMDMMYMAGEDAQDNKDGRWDEIDKDFSNGVNLFPDLICKE